MKLKKIAAMLMAGVMCIGLMAGCPDRPSMLVILESFLTTTTCELSMYGFDQV